MIHVLIPIAFAFQSQPTSQKVSSPALPVVDVDHDNIEIAESCTLKITANPILDADNNGVIHITRDGVTVNFAGETLHGAKPDQLPDSFAGFGVKIAAKNVTLRNATISGYKVGIHALEADGLTIADCDVSNNFHQHLKSTPQAEDASDWLWPHANDNHEWMTNYGAGIYVEKSNHVTLHDIRARKTQNGIILDRVNESKVYDCDCSFLSGWGLAMWRSSKNVISRNAFDFCIRGYSHGVYNRGQDSAGILMFEQCCENVIAENSATHCGDGFFGFAGKEALGEVNPRNDVDWYMRRGCNDNVFTKNDFSFAAAHGLEMTFSFGNRICDNTFLDNAICGIWGGYSQEMVIDRNLFQHNGQMAYGLERGGINIEHGKANQILHNRFHENRCGVHLWWDDDPGLASTPWAKSNDVESESNEIIGNAFERDVIAIQLRQSQHTVDFMNVMNSVATPLDADEQSAQSLIRTAALDHGRGSLPDVNIHGRQRPVGTRAVLAGRENIIMTEWGPYDWHSYRLHRFADRGSQHKIRLLGAFPRTFRGLTAGGIQTDDPIEIAMIDDTAFSVKPTKPNALTPYRVSIRMNDDPDGIVSYDGTLTGGTWEVWTFSSACDPREDVARWRNAGEAEHQSLPADDLNFRFGSGGMSEAMKLPARLPHDHFGVIATRSLTIPAGKWRIKTTSDDGIRVWMDDQIIIDDWTWHGPTKHDYEFDAKEAREYKFRVEYFELDGHAILSVEFAVAE